MIFSILFSLLAVLKVRKVEVATLPLMARLRQVLPFLAVEDARGACSRLLCPPPDKINAGLFTPDARTQDIIGIGKVVLLFVM